MGSADGWFTGRIHRELTVRIRTCPTMEADHDLAMSQPLARLGRMWDAEPTVECVALGYRLGRATSTTSGSPFTHQTRGLVVPVIV